MRPNERGLCARKIESKNKMKQVKLLRRSKSSGAESTEQEIQSVQRGLHLLMRRCKERAQRAEREAHNAWCHYKTASMSLTAFTRLVKKGAV
jgi:hypothetical protein